MAEVLHPPVDVARWSSLVRGRPEHFLWLGRLVAYKRPDIAVEAARMLGSRLIVVGDGPERKRLEAGAPENVTFVGHASEQTVRSLLSRTHAVVFPGEEDFGIAPVEALAAGVPVVAYDAGGARDFIVSGVNGLMVAEQDPGAFAHAMSEASIQPWSESMIRNSAQRFGVDRFRCGLREIIARTVGVTAL
jgi:glycosyltransferase involved in cell wall biosynthesis